MSWQEDISSKLQQASEIAVRFDMEQELTAAQKQTAKNNVGVDATASNISGDDYKITFNY